MPTVINNPSGNGEGSGVGVILGVLVAIIIIILFFVYGLPALRGAPASKDAGINVDVNLPNPDNFDGGADALAN
jgi:hypothetical protein